MVDLFSKCGGHKKRDKIQKAEELTVCTSLADSYIQQLFAGIYCYGRA